MHFEITKGNIFLGKGLPPYNAQNPYTYIHLYPQKAWNLAFLAHNRRIFLRKGASGNPQTYKFKLLKGHAFYLTKYNLFLHKGALPWTPVRALPLDPIRDPIGGPRPHSWVLALRARCFSR